MRKLLWIGDAVCDSGFARCTHKTLDVLRRTWDVSVLAINFLGDTRLAREYPYEIYPAWPGGDFLGVKRLLDVMDIERPDLVVIQNDPWNIPPYTRELNKLKNPPVTVGAIAIDAKNAIGTALNDLNWAIFWTRFAETEALRGGMLIPSGVVPLGVDLDVYQPTGDRWEVRREIGLPDDMVNGYIVGNMNRNQPRKRLDLTIQYFAKWVHQNGVKDAFLYLHVCPTGDDGYNLGQLASYYGVQDRVVLAQPNVWKGVPEHWLIRTFQSFDAQITTTQGEGWGLTTMEGMACGVPQIVPDWSALGEWTRGASRMVPCTSTAVTLPKANSIGGVMDERRGIKALADLYRDREQREGLTAAGLKLVAQDKYRWETIGQRFAEQVEQAYGFGSERTRRRRDAGETTEAAE